MFTAKTNSVLTTTLSVIILLFITGISNTLFAQSDDEVIVIARTGDDAPEPGDGEDPPPNPKTLHHQRMESVDQNGHLWVVSSFLGQATLSEDITLFSHSRDYYIARYNSENQLINHYHISGLGIEAITHITTASNNFLIAGKLAHESRSDKEPLFVAAIHETGAVQWMKRMEPGGVPTLHALIIDQWGDVHLNISATTRFKMEWEEITTRYYSIKYDATGQLLQMERAPTRH